MLLGAYADGFSIGTTPDLLTKVGGPQEFHLRCGDEIETQIDHVGRNRLLRGQPMPLRWPGPGQWTKGASFRPRG